MKLEKYIIYIDNGNRIIEEAIPATNQFAAECEVSVKGKIVKVENVTDTIHISSEKVAEALRRYGHFNQTENDFIINTLTVTGIAEQAHDTIKTGLTFKWENSNTSANDNIIEVLKANHIDCHYDKPFQLFADFYGVGKYMKVSYAHVEGITYEIVMEQ